MIQIHKVFVYSLQSIQGSIVSLKIYYGFSESQEGIRLTEL